MYKIIEHIPTVSVSYFVEKWCAAVSYHVMLCITCQYPCFIDTLTQALE